jgi:hypothetical protein
MQEISHPHLLLHALFLVVYEDLGVLSRPLDRLVEQKRHCKGKPQPPCQQQRGHPPNLHPCRCIRPCHDECCNLAQMRAKSCAHLPPSAANTCEKSLSPSLRSGPPLSRFLFSSSTHSVARILLSSLEKLRMILLSNHPKTTSLVFRVRKFFRNLRKHFSRQLFGSVQRPREGSRGEDVVESHPCPLVQGQRIGIGILSSEAQGGKV